MTLEQYSLIPRSPHPDFVTCSTKSGGKAWKDLSRCLPLLTSCTVATCSHNRSSCNQTHRTNCTERMNWIQGKKSEGGEDKPRCEQTEHDVSSGMHHVINPSRPSPPLFVLQATKAGRGGLGMRLRAVWDTGTGSILIPNRAHLIFLKVL